MRCFLLRSSSKVTSIVLSTVVDIEPHQNYEVTVTVRNISKKVKRIKFSNPDLPNFKIDYDMQGPVAAGLAIKINVSFETDQERDFHDKIEITTEDSSTS